jgi:uncharacterized protein YaiL (DUF2058 family)
VRAVLEKDHMLDLKAKLLAAGLVTEDQVARADEEKKRQQERLERRRDAPTARSGGPRAEGRDGPRPDRPVGEPRAQTEKRPPRPPRPPREQKPQLSDDERWAQRVAKLAALPKSEQYDVLRGWVERTRQDDPKVLPSENAERFHFPKGDGSIGWVTIEPDLKAALSEGRSAVVVYMGFNGALHAVVPREVALDIHKVRPEWLRALAEYEFEPLAITPPRKRKKKGAANDADASGIESESAALDDETPSEGALSTTPDGEQATDVVTPPDVEVPSSSDVAATDDRTSTDEPA